MDHDLSPQQPQADDVVLVTGAGRGLGAAIARAAVREGFRVVVNYRHSVEHAEVLVGELGPRALAVRGDVTEADDVAELFATASRAFGTPVGAVVNNALPDFRFDGDARSHLDVIAWDEVAAQLEGVVKGALLTTQAALRGFDELGGGRIVNIGTNLVQNPVVPYHDYTAAKGALLAFTRTAAAELGPRGVRVNLVSGGLLRTTDASAPTPPAIFDLIAHSTPLRRVTTPAEFADAVLFFLSPASRAVTGQNLVVDGGLVFN